MLSTATVTVETPVADGTDRFGNAVHQTVANAVEGVLVAPGATADLEAGRPDGVTVAYTLHFPRSYTEPLEGCTVVLPEPWAGRYRVIGDPRPYMDANCPTRWNRPVEVEAAHG